MLSISNQNILDNAPLEMLYQLAFFIHLDHAMRDQRSRKWCQRKPENHQAGQDYQTRNSAPDQVINRKR
jgi:hypothetical protein